MSEPRKVELSFTSRYSLDGEEVVIASIEDLENLCAKHGGNPLIISVGKDGKLSSIEVYDDYRE